MADMLLAVDDDSINMRLLRNEINIVNVTSYNGGTVSFDTMHYVNVRQHVCAGLSCVLSIGGETFL